MNRALPLAPPGTSIVPAYAPSPPAIPDRIDLRGSLMFFQRRLWLMAAVIVLALIGGVVLTLMQPKMYRATALVSLNATEDRTATDNGDPVEGPPPSSAYVDTQVQIITSRAIAEEVAVKLGMIPAQAGSSPEQRQQRRSTLDRLQRNLKAQRMGETFALDISYEAPSGEQAAKIVNEFARAFTQWQLHSRVGRNKETIALLQKRLEELRGQAHADTEALQNYRIRNNLLSTSGSSLTEQEISSYNQAVTQARAQAAEDQARLNTARAQLRGGSAGDDVGEALNSGVIGSLRAREAQVGGQVANLEANYGPNYPALKQAKNELAEINRQIEAEINRVISNLQAKVRVSGQRLASLNGSLSQARGKLASNNAAMVGLDELIRKADASQGLYESYLNRYKTLVAQEGSQRPNARVLSFAEPPVLPFKPNLILNLVLAFAIGVAAALGLAFLAETLFSGITTAAEVEERLGVRYIGSIPLLKSVDRKARNPLSALSENPKSAFAEAFRAIRTSVEQAVPGKVEIIAITSALPKEGKTTMSACLARSMAMQGKHVLMIDCDLRRRGLARYMAANPDHPGLLEVLQGDTSWDDALIQVDNNFHFITTRNADESEAELLTGEQFDLLLQQLRNHYDYIVLDLPPMLPVAATRIIAGKADATVMAVRWRKTPDHAVKAALHQLPHDRHSLAGVVLTQVDMRKQSRFGYGDAGYYYQSYKQYYL
ncbi:polysaccharide biosynthesis tyrosine autokinase [Stakelama sediminis]|uniref:non-specific protein-tyrosine kinase n=1 Tax=Stakelama sediminis TaxID=463200 RepID=A0A840Z1G5_9SPHN|nr:polysaccharide biosynthesis tyrosine autokinase [Stakelama sediminis]MBB5719971.1 capsular exopolysaccharide synthesis family protein [Stakelama sediminis]